MVKMRFYTLIENRTFLKSIFNLPVLPAESTFLGLSREKVSHTVNSGQRHRSTVPLTKHKKNGQNFSRTGPIESGSDLNYFSNCHKPTEKA